MPRRHTPTCFLALAIAAACPLVAATAQPAAESQRGEKTAEADRLFRRHLEAIGGRKALESHRTRKIEGHLSTSPGEGFALITLWQESPDKLRARVEEPGEPSVETVYDGSYAWRVVGRTQAELLRNEPLFDVAEGADMLWPAQVERRYPQRESAGRLERGGKAYDGVHVRSQYQRDESLLFDPSTGLLEVVETTRAGMPLRVLFEDYREVDGLRLPHRIVQIVRPGAENEVRSTLTYTSIRANVQDVPSWDPPRQIREIIERIEKDSAGG